MGPAHLPPGQPDRLYGRPPTAREQASIAHALSWNVPFLLCRSPRAGGQPFALAGGGALVVGVEAQADLRVEGDVHVSRVHATLSSRRGRWGVRDSGSTNGLRVDGTPAHGWVQLRHGATVELGSATRLLFVDRADAAWHTPPLDAVRSRLDALTGGQRRVVRTLAEPMRVDHDAGALSDREVAARLDIAVSTVRTHVSNAYERLGLPPEVVDRRLRLARLGLSL